MQTIHKDKSQMTSMLRHSNKFWEYFLSTIEDNLSC